MTRFLGGAMGSKIVTMVPATNGTVQRNELFRLQMLYDVGNRHLSLHDVFAEWHS